MGHPGMGCGRQGIGLGEPGVIYLVGKKFAVPDQGDCVDLSTRINLDSHQLSAIVGGKLKSGIKGYLAIVCTLCVQGTFGLGHGFDAVSEYDIDVILGVPMEALPVMGSVRPVG